MLGEKDERPFIEQAKEARLTSIALEKKFSALGAVAAGSFLALDQPHAATVTGAISAITYLVGRSGRIKWDDMISQAEANLIDPETSLKEIDDDEI